MIKLYRQIELAEEIVIGADPGEGVSWCAGVAISKNYLDTPLIFHGNIESPQFGIELYKIGLYIKTKTGQFPLLAIERNTGAATIEKVRNLGYPMDKLYKQQLFDKVSKTRVDRIGWVTSASNRRKMLDELAMSIRKKEIDIYDKDIVSELLTFIIDRRTNEPRHEKGRFSDLIMAGAIGWQIIKVTGGESKWVKDTPLDDGRTIPERAGGFIVEKYEAPKDWRNPL